MSKRRPFDSVLFLSTLVLVIGGFLIFMSASLGLLARDGAQFSDIALSQFGLGIVGGLAALYVTSHIPYRLWRQYALVAFTVSALASVAVFLPIIGLELHGARSWLNFGFTTFQPAEALKIGYVVYLATWLSQKRSKKTNFFTRMMPFSIITGVVAVLLLLQPDTGTFIVIASAGAAMLFASGAPWKDMAVIGLAALIIGAGVFFAFPHARDRIETFLKPSDDVLGAGYQVHKSIIAVGSGELWGRGFGQSIQKFTTLPEPTSDSIFAIFAEEFGFIGSTILIIGFLVFLLRALYLAARAPDVFSGLVLVGIAILIGVQSFLNIGAMLAVFPLTGLPLIFVSHGGSALFMALASVGIMLNISRTIRH